MPFTIKSARCPTGNIILMFILCFLNASLTTWRKNIEWDAKNFLSVLRADFAQLQNEVLERNGFSIRVDHQSLKAQKAEAERNGDTFLAGLFNRIPEEYIGIISLQDDDNPKLKRLKDFRNPRNHHYNLIFKPDALTTESAELETKDAATYSITNAKNFIDSQNCDSTQTLSAIVEVHKWKRAVISYRDAKEQAKLEYMTKTEREIWHRYFETLAQKKHLEDFLL